MVSRRVREDQDKGSLAVQLMPRWCYRDRLDDGESSG